MRKLLPGSLRRWGRRRFDACFCRSVPGLERLGRDSGWWVLASRLSRGAGVLSGGAGNDISFELDLVRKRGCRVALFDPSPTGMRTVEASICGEEGLSYFPIGLDARDSRVAFAAPYDPKEGSYGMPVKGRTAELEFECVSPKTALDRACFESIELVKIDIEGFEYGFIEAMLATGIQPPQLAVEFHHFLPDIPHARTWRTIRQLHDAGYRIVHKEQCDYLFVHAQVLRG